MNPICLLLGGILRLPNCQPPQQGGPIIVTTFGPVEGTTFPGIDGSSVRAFRGIIYGHLEARGQPSVPLAPWQAVRSGARVAPPCPSGSNTARREDCLILNVYVSAGRKNNKTLLPTLLVLLSEELVPPSPSSPSPSSLLASSLIPQGVALVTVQYRSGVFGFLHSESPNTGLFDVATAFRFVLDNADAFGLDQTKITLAGFGEGAQVASVMSLSPATKGLLHGLALFSGSSFTIGGSPDPTEKFFSRLDCGNQTDSVCFRHLTLEQVEEAADGLQFHPTVGEMLVPSEPSVLLDSRHKFPTMMTISDYPDLGVTNAEFDEYIKNVAKRFETGVWQRIQAETKIKNYYYPLEGELIEEQFADLKSDVSYRIGAVREAKARSVYAPVYVSRMDDNYNELMLLLEAGMNDHKKFLIDSIVAFVKTGNPSTTQLAWPKYSDEEQYLFVGNTTFVAKGFLDEELVFWSNLCKEMRKDIFTGKRLPDPDSGSQLSLLVTFVILVLMQ